MCPLYRDFTVMLGSIISSNLHVFVLVLLVAVAVKVTNGTFRAKNDWIEANLE